MSILFTGAFIDHKEKENNMPARNERNHAWINILPYSNLVQVEIGWVEYGDSAALWLK